MDMTVLERQQARLKWLPQQQYSYVNQNNSLEPHPMPQLQGFYHQASLDGAMFDWKKEPAKLYFGDNELVNYNNLSVPGTGLINAEVAPHSLEIDQCLPRTSGFQAGVAGKMAVDMVGQDVVANDVALVEKKQFSHGRDSARKRKAEFVAAEECNKKRTRGEAEVESRVQEKGIAETSAESSKDQNISEVQKPGYIHVQARRGQATDSHSLAERARRDKISKKIKCLQDLVPSCNKMMGRAGMLDEIINYVQSLQRQVEFLSIKIAALNPNMESNNDNFSGKEFSAYVASSPAASVPSAIANLPHLQHALAQKAATSSEQDLLPSPAEIPSERITSSSPFISEQLLNSSHFSEVQPFWNADCQNLHSVDFPSRLIN